MRWRGEQQSDNIEDQRGGPGPQVLVGGGLGTILIVVVIALLGGDPLAFLQQVQNQGPPAQNMPGEPPEPGVDDELKEFVAVVLKDTEDVWTEQFAAMGKQYRKPHMVLYTGRVQSGCGFASAAVGPFYCPADEKVYLDLSFFQELRSRFGAPGDFAQAYVIAHEIGHHVQKLLGISQRVQDAQERGDKVEAKRLSVRLELQADFLAGVWANHANKMRNMIEAGDVEEALRAANAIGDDRLQKQAQGYVVPDSFTHGSSAQRMKWFRKGLETGDIRQGDTFEARDL